MKAHTSLMMVPLAILGTTAAAIVAEGDGYQSALVNFRFIANTVWTTEEAVHQINPVLVSQR